ncbi:hypothetical protein [Sphingobacterium sp. Ag1]|uniref:hypothetical protein n=1 Tax=Sphingobacterium sp. Ag1 TaxID=1643451 RepID=UPI000B227F33|nr:hypothetical protein [Sphingobacterium sp. Ag1]
MGIIITIGLVAMLAFGFFLYATIKTKSTRISQYPPFKQWAGKTVILDKQTVLISEKVKLYPENGYPYLLLDSLHPDWPYIEERIQLGDYALVERFPAGTSFHIEKAVQFTGGVSGSSTPFVFGKIQHGGKRYGTAYQWGTMDIAKFMDKVEASWYFHQAPWQPKADTVFYALPEARWW